MRCLCVWTRAAVVVVVCRRELVLRERLKQSPLYVVAVIPLCRGRRMWRLRVVLSAVEEVAAATTFTIT